MTSCETCGNDYDKPLEIVVNGISHYFDCFECAIHALAPECDHCEGKIIGHGVDGGGKYYCCAHCAHEAGGMAGGGRAWRGRSTARPHPRKARRPRGGTSAAVGGRK